MTNLDLANPQHVEALRWAASNILRDGADDVAAKGAPDMGFRDEALVHTAERALLDPARSAELVRGLLGRAHLAFLSVIGWHATPGGTPARLTLTVVDPKDRSREPAPVFAYVPMSDLTRLVCALLDATSAAEAMAAVMEVGR